MKSGCGSKIFSSLITVLIVAELCLAGAVGGPINWKLRVKRDKTKTPFWVVKFEGGKPARVHVRSWDAFKLVVNDPDGKVIAEVRSYSDDRYKEGAAEINWTPSRTTEYAVSIANLEDPSQYVDEGIFRLTTN